LDRAQTLGIPIIAVDRPGYGASAAFASSKPTIERNAEILDVAIGEIWQGFRDAVSGIVLIGHSIGGAVSIAISARKPAWPLLGLAISGVGLTPVPESEEQWAALPDVPAIELPSALKDQYMFGPTGTFDERIMPAASHISDAPAPRAELLDIVTGWPAAVNSLAREITVPVHYRQAEFDRLWVTDAEQVRLFAAAFAQANSVSAELYPQAGHCIDFHRVGEAFQFEQLAFALRCAVRSGV
jgi:pimeloyl-ACP methyl ester carboxylesterase